MLGKLLKFRKMPKVKRWHFACPKVLAVEAARAERKTLLRENS
jgi:hypothetical protein